MSSDTPQVQRTTVLQMLQAKLDTSQNDTNVLDPARIINFYGSPGTGKTFLLRQVFEQFQQTFPIFWLDFGTERSGTALPAAQPLHTIIEELAGRVDALEYLSDDTLSHSEETHARFAYAAPPAADTDTVVFVLDHLDDVPYWKWLQKEIIEPLTKQKALIICASQSPLFWDFWELRESCEVQQIEPFSEEEIRDYFPEAAPLLTSSVKQLTEGYPLHLDRLRKLFLFISDQRETSSADEPALAIEAWLQGLSPLNQRICRYTGWLRTLDVPVMQQVLDTLDPGWTDQEHKIKVLNGARTEFRKHGYPEYSGHRKADHDSYAQRKALENHIHLQEPDKYFWICSMLDDFYARRFYKNPKTEKSSFPEWLYFSTVPFIHRIAGSDADQWTQQLKSLLERGKLVGKSLAVLVHKDEEVMQQLYKSGLLEHLQEALKDALGNDQEAPPLLNDIEWHRYCQQIIKHWIEQTPQLALVEEIIPGGLFAMLQQIATLGTYFELSALRQHITECFDPDGAITPENVYRVVSVMQSCSLVQPEHGKYRLARQVYPLLQGVSA